MKAGLTPVLIVAVLCWPIAAQKAAQPPAALPQQATPLAQQPPELPQQAAPAPPAPVSGTVVIDPGHGGADAGARGSGGVLEKDVVMSLAQLLRAALERQGMRVVLTRQASDGPSYDDRAATANAYRGAVVITLHVSSTGAIGTACAYYSAAHPPAPDGPVAVPQKTGETQPARGPKPAGLLRWEDAQQAHLAASKRLAEAVQLQIKQKLEKSSSAPGSVALRDLRSVNAPAIAVELASVSVKDRKTIDPFLAPLAEAIAKGVANFRSPSAAQRTEAR